MMTATNGSGNHRVFTQTLACGLNSTPQEPWAGKEISIPSERGSVIRNYRWVAGFRHRIVPKRGEVRSEQRKSVSGVTKQVSLEQRISDIVSAVGRESR